MQSKSKSCIILSMKKSHTTSDSKSYSLLDSGKGRKLEQFGPYILSRPCSQAIWKTQLPESEWQKADAIYVREEDKKWTKSQNLPEKWSVNAADIHFKIDPTDFGHLGIFPEQIPFWQWIQTTIETQKQHRGNPIQILNLFAYSGGSTLAAAKAGAQVCHLDASKGMVAWARENAVLNGLDGAPIRWIVDDVNKFLLRELKRGRKYDGIILDPPTFGRGSQGELFKIEDDINALLRQCRELLSEDPLFILFSCHTPGFTPLAMEHLLCQTMEGLGGHIDKGEMVLTGREGVFAVPSGTYARWTDALT